MGGDYFTDEQKKADDVIRFFEPNPKLEGAMKDMAHYFAGVASMILDKCPRCPQRTMALNSLLDAKDRAVRSLMN